MSGSGMAAASCATVSGGGGTPSLSVSISFPGEGVYNVAGASGNLADQIGAQMGYNVEGGVPPYTTQVSVLGDPSGKLTYYQNVFGAESIGYSGFSLNEVEVCYLQIDATDSAGTHKSARYPPVGQAIAIKRTS